MDVSPDLRADRAIAAQLRHTWPAFFARFGRLTAVQRHAIPDIMRGIDVLVCSPTASGKTEAACAPLIERQLRLSGDWTILYVSPTRALVNDLFERLGGPLRELSLRLARRTGDHRTQFDQPPHVLITTPESFDSLLCRGRHRDMGHVLARVEALVLDEIHLLHGTARGEQTAWLIKRLRRLREYAQHTGISRRSQIQTVALSATITDPVGVAQKYLHSDASIVEIGGGREIETVAVRNAPTPSVERALVAHLSRSEIDNKILVFCNARRRVDRLTAQMRRPLGDLGFEVRAHHGSLSQRERETAEASMKTKARIVLFATSTLELGVDIGDIDLVVLDGPPPNVPSLLQRIGRGNRRTSTTRVMPCGDSMAQMIIQAAMIESAREGNLGPVEIGPCHAVARQELASFIFQGPKRARMRDALESLLEDCADPVVQSSLLNHLLQSGELIEDVDGIRLNEDWLDSADRGAIHSNIEGLPGLSVVDEQTGDEIAVGIEFSGGEGLTVGGRLLEVRGWQVGKLEVRDALSNVSEGAWNYRTRGWMKGSGQADAVRRYLGIPDSEWPVLLDGSRICAFHFGGGRRRAVLEMLMAVSDEHPVAEIDEWRICVRGDRVEKPRWLGGMSAGLLEVEVSARVDALERRLARPLANRTLPHEVRVDELRRWLCIEHELETIETAEWRSCDDPDVRSVLSLLASELSNG